MTDQIAFTVHGFNVTVAQRDAGLAAMQGTFTGNDVGRALVNAGVEDLPGQSYTVGRAADRMLQAERKAGRIRVAKGKGRGAWERVL